MSAGGLRSCFLDDLNHSGEAVKTDDLGREYLLDVGEAIYLHFRNMAVRIK